jgi:hypothetical protein
MVKDRFFKVRNVLICKKTFEDGRLAMLALDQENCQFTIEPYYFDIFFRNTDWSIEELDSAAFEKAVVEKCGFFPEMTL